MMWDSIGCCTVCGARGAAASVPPDSALTGSVGKGGLPRDAGPLCARCAWSCIAWVLWAVVLTR
eukprot:1160999-Pelagomonas_calceolata.AAC.7